MDSNSLRITYVGLVIALFGVPLIVFLYSLFIVNQYTDAIVIAKEASIFLLLTLLLFIIVKQPLQSIGLHNKNWLKSIKLGIGVGILMFVAIIICALILEQFDIPVGGNEGRKYESISLWTMSLVTIRAGIVEEVCYRGYVMERLEKLSKGNFWIYFVIPVVLFSLAHYSQGVAGFVISFVAGAIMAYVYWKKRDLKANIIAHFLVDFVPNVLLQLT